MGLSGTTAWILIYICITRKKCVISYILLCGNAIKVKFRTLIALSFAKLNIYNSKIYDSKNIQILKSGVCAFVYIINMHFKIIGNGGPHNLLN